MTPEEKELLTRSVKLAEENNKILHVLKRTARWQTFWSLIKTLIIIIPLVVGYLFLEPYLQPLIGDFKQIQGMMGTSSQLN